jgi:acetoin utilization deacetylase AcuC-like enzyme
MDGDKKLTISMSRPPGHHAGREFYHGFCYFNNSAVAAQEILKSGKKVAILDIDVHHGDGVQDIFYDHPSVLYVSLHADPNEVFPNTGHLEEQGTQNAMGTTLNLPFPIGVSVDDYFGLLDIAENRIYEFKPDFLIIEAGFDGHVNEFPDLPPLTQLDDIEYGKIGQTIGNLNIPSLVIMGGGYNHEVTPNAFLEFIKGLESGLNITGAEIYSVLDTIPED